MIAGDFAGWTKASARKSAVTEAPPFMRVVAVPKQGARASSQKGVEAVAAMVRPPALKPSATYGLS